MFISRRQYEIEKLKSQQRIEYLESLICPNLIHDFVEINSSIVDEDGNGTGRSVSTYRCSRCGKVVTR
jgi:hypothetical protein